MLVTWPGCRSFITVLPGSAGVTMAAMATMATMSAVAKQMHGDEAHKKQCPNPVL